MQKLVEARSSTINVLGYRFTKLSEPINYWCSKCPFELPVYVIYIFFYVNLISQDVKRTVWVLFLPFEGGACMQMKFKFQFVLAYFKAISENIQYTDICVFTAACQYRLYPLNTNPVWILACKSSALKALKGMSIYYITKQFWDFC